MNLFGDIREVCKIAVTCMCLRTDAESRLETERASRQKAEKDLLEMEKQIGSLRVDVSEYEQRAADVAQKLAAETDKVDPQDTFLCCCCWLFVSIWLVSVSLLATENILQNSDSGCVDSDCIKQVIGVTLQVIVCMCVFTDH